jgi:hypothetical protein
MSTIASIHNVPTDISDEAAVATALEPNLKFFQHDLREVIASPSPAFSPAERRELKRVLVELGLLPEVAPKRSPGSAYVPFSPNLAFRSSGAAVLKLARDRAGDGYTRKDHARKVFAALNSIAAARPDLELAAAIGDSWSAYNKYHRGPSKQSLYSVPTLILRRTEE